MADVQDDAWATVGSKPPRRGNGAMRTLSSSSLSRTSSHKPNPPQRTPSHNRTKQSGGRGPLAGSGTALRSQSFSVHSSAQSQPKSSKAGSSTLSLSGGRSSTTTTDATSLSPTPPSQRKSRAPKRAHSYAGQVSSRSSSPVSGAIVSLWTVTGEGPTLESRAVPRYSSDVLLSQRMFYTDAPPIRMSSTSTNSRQRHSPVATRAPQPHAVAFDWTPHDRCHWQDADRLRHIEQEQTLFYNFQPLVVNDETRWKRRSAQRDVDPSSHTTVERAAAEAATLAILNKLSWTNLEKLTVQFVQALSGANTTSPSHTTDEATATSSISQELIAVTMAVVVDKAMLEPHFASLYARLSVNLSNIHKTFKRTVLRLCQEQFEATGHDETSDSVTATPSAASSLARKKSIGLMIFIGELYVMGLIKANIMISCCERLLVPSDEEKLESFCKLMTTIGKRFHEETDESVATTARQLWDTVYRMAGKTTNREAVLAVTAPSTRLKFLLQALVELKENDWVQVRHEHEKAKTIAQIHAQVAEEAKRGPITKTTSAVLKRSQSGGALLVAASTVASSATTSSLARHSSHGKPIKATSASATSDGLTMPLPAKPKRDKLRRVKSEVSASAAAVLQQRANLNGSSHNGTKATTLSMMGDAVTKQSTAAPSLAECATQTKTILKEYFISGDRGEAMALIDQMVGMSVSAPGHVERGTAVVQAGILLVMEMKEVQVRKFLDVVSKCLDDQKLDRASLIPACMDPLDSLRDIEIDAPLASTLLALVIAEWLKKKVDDGDTAIHSLEALLAQPPASFQHGEARPASFVALVLKQRGDGVVSEADVDVVSKFMSEEDRNQYESAHDFVQSFLSP